LYELQAASQYEREDIAEQQPALRESLLARLREQFSLPERFNFLSLIRED
jgi:hypothetical protein